MSQQRDSGLAALQQGNTQVAISLLEAACRTNPNDYQAHQYLGMAYQQGGRGQEAMQTLTRAVNLNPTDAQARYNLAVAMEAAGFANEARQVYAQALQIQPVYPLASQALTRLGGGAPAQPAAPSHAPFNAQPAAPAYTPLNASPSVAPSYAPFNAEQPAATSYAPLNAPQTAAPAYTPLNQQASGIPLNAPSAAPPPYAGAPQPGYGAPAAMGQPYPGAYVAPGAARSQGYNRPMGPTCDECGSENNVRDVHYRQNIGAVYLRFSKERAGEMCESCATKYFWEMTLTTFFLGSFGIISAILSPFFILSNIVSYVKGANAVGKISAVAFALFYVMAIVGIFYFIGTSHSDSPSTGYRSRSY